MTCGDFDLFQPLREARALGPIRSWERRPLFRERELYDEGLFSAGAFRARSQQSSGRDTPFERGCHPWGDISGDHRGIRSGKSGGVSFDPSRRRVMTFSPDPPFRPAKYRTGCQEPHASNSAIGHRGPGVLATVRIPGRPRLPALPRYVGHAQHLLSLRPPEPVQRP